LHVHDDLAGDVRVAPQRGERMNRRCLIVMTVMLASAVATPALAQELVVGIFGGTFVDNAKKCHAEPFQKATGATVKYVLGSSVQMGAKLRAAAGRSELDVTYMDSEIVKQVKAENLLQPMDPAKVAHWNDLYDASKDK